MSPRPVIPLVSSSREIKTLGHARRLIDLRAGYPFYSAGLHGSSGRGVARGNILMTISAQLIAFGSTDGTVSDDYEPGLSTLLFIGFSYCTAGGLREGSICC